MFGIGVPELILILVIGLVVFGPGKLPDVGRAVGKSLNEFKKATSGILDNEPAKTDVAVKADEPAKVESVKPVSKEANSTPAKEEAQKSEMK